MGTLIVIVVIGVTILLGRYALAQGRKIESQKKFMKNMNDYDKKKQQKEMVEFLQTMTLSTTLIIIGIIWLCAWFVYDSIHEKKKK